MKKLLAILLVLAMALGLCACSAKPQNTQTTEIQTETAEEAPAEEAAEEAPAGNTVKAGFIFLHDENSTYDLNFLNAAKEACEAMGVEYIIKTNIPEGQECYDAAMELIDEGCNFIFADSFGHEDFMIQAAKENPNVQFAHATGTKAHTEGLSNYHNAFAEIFEGRFLAGVAAGMKLNEMIENGTITADQAKMGYVGAYTYAEVISGYSSFFLGARYVCPSVTMEVTFTGSWYDETAEKEGANKLIQNGCVLISQHADSMGAPTACETAGVPNVSYNGSTESVAPNTFIVSSRIDWAPYMTYCMECIRDGKEIETDWTGTLATGSVKLTDVNTKVAAEGTVEKMEEVKAMLENDSLEVYDVTTFTVDGKGVDSYMADVDTDPEYTPDTEAVVDGAFRESKFRSAPYFDLQIDGITLLDTAF